MLVVVAIPVVLMVIALGMVLGSLKGLGFTEHTLWDLIDLALVPLALVLAAWGLNRSERSTERTIASNRAQDEALQDYLDRMSELLLQGKLTATRVDREVRQARTVARARTLTILSRLGAERKAIVVQFLFESDLLEREHPPYRPVEEILLPYNLPTDPIGHKRLSYAKSLYEQAGERPVVSLASADLNGAHLKRANLRYADLGFAEMRGTDLREAFLVGAALNQTDLTGSDLRGANLTEAYLAGADLHRADLRFADLHGVTLFNADLTEANLDGARLWVAQLQGCDLRGASLRNVDFEGALGLTYEQLQ